MSRTYRGLDLSGQALEVAVAGDRIESISAIPSIADSDLPLIAPPLVDLQQNGALGLGFNRMHEAPATLRTVAAHLRRHGVGRVLMTTSTYPYEHLLESYKAFDHELRHDGDLERLYFGAFSEGIYVSREYGWRGAHNPEFMRDPSWDEWARLQDAAGGRIRMFNVDPELPGALDAIRAAVKCGQLVSLGHCGPKPGSIRAAADVGADIVTHFANGAPPQIHRHNNPFWTWLADGRFRLGMIADGHHLPGDVILAAVAAKSKEKVFLVSDAAGHSGMPPGDYERFIIEPDGRCHVKGDELLAGNWHQADRCVEFMCSLGWSLPDAWRQQSQVPASIVGIELPKLAPGEPAEFVLARWQEPRLMLEQVVSMGRELLTSPIHPRMV